MFLSLSLVLALGQYFLFYTAMGVEHFTFFGANGATPAVLKLIHDVRALGLSIDVLPWNWAWSIIRREFNQRMAVNVCLSWQMPYFENILVTDFDELIVPSGADTKTLVELIAELDALTPDASSYQFEHYLLTTAAEDDKAAPGQSSKQGIAGLRMFELTERYGPWPEYRRAKSIHKPERVVAGGIHRAYRSVTPYETMNVSSDLGRMYHLRDDVIGLMDKARVFNLSSTHDESLGQFYKPVSTHWLRQYMEEHVL